MDEIDDIDLSLDLEDYGLEENPDFPNSIDEKSLQDYLPTEKTDKEIINELGVDMPASGTYDMAARQGREALAKDLHHGAREVFEEIGLGSEEVIEAQAEAYQQVIEERGLSLPVRFPPLEVIRAGTKALDQKEKGIESEVYNNLAVLGATQRELGQEEIYHAIASAAAKHHVEIDRMDGINLDNLEGYRPEINAESLYQGSDSLDRIN